LERAEESAISLVVLAIFGKLDSQRKRMGTSTQS